jgi:oligopeptidase B
MSRRHDPRPPVAKRIPKRIANRGDVRVDDYYWIKDRSDPDVLEYIKAENAYTKRIMKHTEALQSHLYKELVDRIVEDDVSVPVKIDEYYYYERLEKGNQYPVYCRKKGNLKAKEERILDQNELGKGHKFFSIGGHRVSPDHKLIAYLVDTTGSERHELCIKDLASGRILDRGIERVSRVEWANDSRTLVYTVLNDVFQAGKTYVHVLARSSRDKLVYDEKDPHFENIYLSKSKSKRFIMLTTASPSTSEVLYMDADRPNKGFKSLSGRRHGVLYFAVHHKENFFVLANDIGPEFRLVRASVRSPHHRNWVEMIPTRDGIFLDVDYPVPWLDEFEDYIAVFENVGGISRVRIIDLRTGRAHLLKLEDPLYRVEPMFNPDFSSEVLRLSYSTLTIPKRTYDYNMRTRKLALLKQQPVRRYSPSRYTSERIQATAADGASIPILLVYKNGMKRDGRNPLLLYGYGAYGDFSGAAPSYDPTIFSLLDRGFVYAKAQIRGGGYFGKAWHNAGSMLSKRNSFTDFIACAEHLIRTGFTSKDRITAMGRSAGGLLMGAVTTMRPDLFRSVVAGVPFVDVVTTMLDPSIPLTLGEYEEWGNPHDEDQYAYLKSYSPYDNVRRAKYPDLLVTTAMNDARVAYWEPVKWVAKLRANKTGESRLILRAEMLEGHSGASGRYDWLRELSFIYAFLIDSVGIQE